jgi:CysZ protein
MKPAVQLNNNPVLSATYLLRGLKMLGQPGIRQFVWIPLLINLTIYALGVWAGIHYFSDILNGLMPHWL